MARDLVEQRSEQHRLQLELSSRYRLQFDFDVNHYWDLSRSLTLTRRLYALLQSLQSHSRFRNSKIFSPLERRDSLLLGAAVKHMKDF